jgi:hypothetical protein
MMTLDAIRISYAFVSFNVPGEPAAIAIILGWTLNAARVEVEVE